MNRICDIAGASATVSAVHFALEMSLAAFVVVGGSSFLTLGVIAYRRASVR